MSMLAELTGLREPRRTAAAILIVICVLVSSREVQGEDTGQQALKALSARITETVALKPMTEGIDAAEADLYYDVLRATKETSQATQSKLANEFLKDRWSQSRYKARPFRSFPAYLDLFEHPEVYHGQFATFRGHCQRVVKTTAGDNEHGIEEQYEVWLYTEDSQSNPLVIVCCEIPEGLPVGDHQVDGLVVTGCFYRFYVYRARDVKRFAPLILAGEIRFNADNGTAPFWTTKTIMLTAGFGACLLYFTYIAFSWGNLLFGDKRRSKVKLPEDVNVSVEDVGNHDQPSSSLKDAEST